MIRLGVCIVTGAEVTPDRVIDEKPDAVIVAAGSVPGTPDISGADGINVVQVRDVLQGRARCRSTIVLAGGGCVGCGVAEWLAQQGKKVRIVERLGTVAADLGLNDMAAQLGRLEKLGVEMYTGRKILQINSRGVLVESDGKTEQIEGETIVLAMGAQPDNNLAQALEPQVDVYVAGDCAGVRKTVNAVYEGARAGCAV
jgi:2-enoate reductase